MATRAMDWNVGYGGGDVGFALAGHLPDSLDKTDDIALGRA